VRARRSFMVSPDATSSRPTQVAAGPLSDEEVAAAVKDGHAGRSLRSTCSTASSTGSGGYFDVTLEGPVARVMRVAREARQRREAFGVADVPQRLRQPALWVSAVGRATPTMDPPLGLDSASPSSRPSSPPPAAPFATAIHIRSLAEKPVVLRPAATGSVGMRFGPLEASFDLNAFRALGDAVEVIVASFMGEGRCRLSTKALEQVK